MTPPPTGSTPTLPTTLLNTITSHSAPINALTFSSLGGTYILTGSSDRQIHLTRTTPAEGTQFTSRPIKPTGPIQRYAAHGYAILSVCCASDNQTFASAGGDRVGPFLWDVQSAVTIRRFGSHTSQGHGSRITCVEFAGEGDGVLVSGSDDRSVRVWDVRSKNASPVMVLGESRDGISCLAIPKGNGGGEIVVGSVDGRVRSYDVRMGTVAVDVLPASVTSLDVSRDGRVMLVSSLDSKVRLLERRDGGLLQTSGAGEGGDEKYKNEELRVQSCFAVNEGLVLSGSEGDGAVRVWDVLTGKMVQTVEVSEEKKVVSVLAWREGSKTAGRDGVWAAGGADGVVRIYGSSKSG